MVPNVAGSSPVLHPRVYSSSVERFLDMEEAVGSTPTRPTSLCGHMQELPSESSSRHRKIVVAPNHGVDKRRGAVFAWKAKGASRHRCRIPITPPNIFGTVTNQTMLSIRWRYLSRKSLNFKLVKDTVNINLSD